MDLADLSDMSVRIRAWVASIPPERRREIAAQIDYQDREDSHAEALVWNAMSEEERKAVVRCAKNRMRDPDAVDYAAIERKKRRRKRPAPGEQTEFDIGGLA